MSYRQIKISVFSAICGFLLLFPLRINYSARLAPPRDPIPKEYQNTCHLIVTRPDGTSKTEPVGWPVDGMVDRGWLGGAGIGSSETQLGRYTLVFEFAGQRTEPVSL